MEVFKFAIDFWHNNLLDSTDYVLLLPQQDKTLEERIAEIFNSKLGNRVGTIIKGEQAQALIDLYSVYAFTDKIIIGSFSKPHGRKLYNLINSNITTTEHLINDVILGVM